jgi:hypothetical protein
MDWIGDVPPGRTLAARLEDRDRGRFAGRDAELAFLRRCLQADPPASVIHVTGPGGIGKSALLREFARQARDRGLTVVTVDGRELGPTPGTLDAALRDAMGSDRPVVLLDSYEQMTGLDTYLRRELLPALSDRALVVIAGRSVPDQAWFAGGWESVTARLDLGSLPTRDAQALLAARGVNDERVPAIIDWAGGSPLALSLAADAASSDSSWNAAREPDRPEILRPLIHRLVAAELRHVRLPALAIAAVARTTTPDLLRTLLSPADAQAAYQQLCDLTITEPLGDGITLHDLVRKALLADLRLRNQELERDLRRRIVDYLYDRAVHGQPLLLIEMAHLVENPLLRWGFGWEGSVGFRIDSVREDDAARISRQLGDGEDRLWWQLTRRFFAEAPDRVAVARDMDDRICGYLVCMSQDTAPAFADADPLIGPWLEHARQHADTRDTTTGHSAASDQTRGDSVLWHAAVDFTGEGKVQSMLGLSGVLRSGAANPRFAYLPIDPAYPGAVEFARALGAVHHLELDATIDGQLVECHRLDYGPGGLLAALRAQVYIELGLPLPATMATLAPVKPASAGYQPAQAGDVQAVRRALRDFRVPRDLARNPLAHGDSVQERAESVRLLIRDAARQAFGESENEKLLRSVLMAGYLEPMRSHEDAASRLCMSRAAYFRRLRTAVERLAEHIAYGSASDSTAERQALTDAGYRTAHTALAVKLDAPDVPVTKTPDAQPWWLRSMSDASTPAPVGQPARKEPSP